MTVSGVYERFFEPGEVVEIRALGLYGRNPAWEGFCGGAGVVAGYFDNAEAFHLAAEALDRAAATGVYFTLNPVNPALLARAVNKLKGSPKYLTQDADIAAIRWLPLDFDPVRPAGISANEQELAAAADAAKQVAEWLEGEIGLPKGLRACSGNGYHLCYRLPDMPNNPDTQALVRNAIEAVAARWGSAVVDIDRKVFNPARIWKLYGTTGRKGDHTDDRPHRRSFLFKNQAEGLPKIGVADKKKLSQLAGMAPKDDVKPQGTQKRPGRRKKGESLGRFDLGKYLDHHGIAYNLKDGKGGVRMYRLEQCLFDPNHGKNEASINQAPDGTLTYQCFHNSCAGRRWQDARALISGDDSLAPFCEGYDPNWRPPANSKKKAYTPVDEKKPFLAMNEKNRVQFNCARMADFLEEKFKPFLYEGKTFGDSFWRYAHGVWSIYPEDGVRQVARRELGDHAKPRWVGDAVQTLKDQAYRRWDRLTYDPMWLNCKNGMLHVETMELVPHAPEFYSRVQLPVAYREDATCSLWIETVIGIFADDTAKAEVLQEFFGYCLYPKILFPAALFQIGQGGNGKGVVERVLNAMLGPENVSHISLARMEDKFGPAELRNKLLNSTGETESKPLDVTTFKAAVAGDEIQAEVKYKNDIKFRPIAKHLVSMNAFPGLKEKTDAFFRRIIVLEYNQKFADEEAEDKRLGDKLMAELDGIFAWALEGLKRVLKNEAISTPATVARAKKRFRAKVNPVLMFVEEECVLDKQAQQGGIRVLPQRLYNAYIQWMEEAKLRPLGKQNFYEQIYLNYPRVLKMRESGGTREYFYGIGLLANPKDIEM